MDDPLTRPEADVPSESSDARAEGFGEAFAARAEDFGQHIDEKLKKLPVPVNALGDSACLTLALVVIYYILGLFDIVVLGGVAWFMWLIPFAVIFVVSLGIRSAIKKSRREAPGASSED